PSSCQLTIVLLHYVERFLLLSTARDQPFSIPVILNLRQWPSWRAEVCQDPRSGTAQELNPLQHTKLVPIEILLILLCPSFRSVAMMPVERITTKFAHHQWLLVFRFPFQPVSLCGQTIVPADILVASEHVEIFPKRVVNHLRFSIGVMSLHCG